MQSDPSAPRRYLEDLPLGETLDCGSFALTRDEIIAFAEQFDPQPQHLGETVAAASAFGELVASGVHTQATAIGLVVRTVADVATMFGLALHEARFLLPVRPDVRHAVTARWTEARPSASKPGQGIARIEGVALGPQGQPAMTFGITMIVARRPA
jgi:acyl dehydratase